MKKNISKKYENNISYIALVVIVLVFIIIYSSFLTQIHNCFGQDGNQNMYFLENSIYFMGARHFGYHVLGIEVYKIWKFLGWNKGGMVPLQFISVFFGAMGIGVFYIILFKLFKSNKLSIFFSLFLGFSHAYWFFSTEAISRIPALFFGLVALCLLLSFPKKEDWKNCCYIAIFHSIGIIIDLSCFLFVPIVCIGFFLLSSRKKKSVKSIVVYLIVLFLIMLSVYLPLFISHYDSFSFSKFIKFMTFKTPLSESSLRTAFYTLERTFIAGGKLSMNFLQHKIWSYFKNTFLFLNYLVFSLILGYLIFNIKGIEKFHFKVFLFCIIWFLSPVPFYYYQQPDCLEYYINLLVPFWIISAISYHYLISQARIIKKDLGYIFLSIFLVMFMSYNFSFSIYPRSKIKKSDFYAHYNNISKYMEGIKPENSLGIVFGFRGAPELAIYELNKMLGRLEKKIIPIGDMGSDVRSWSYYEELITDAKECNRIDIFFILCAPYGYSLENLDKEMRKQVFENKRVSDKFVSVLASFTKTAGDRKKRIGRLQRFLNSLNSEFNFRIKISDTTDLIWLQLTK